MFIEKTQWLAHNFALKTKGTFKEGKYGWNQFVNLCPKGWRLPNINDFDNMIRAAETLVAKAQRINVFEIDTNDWDVFEILQESLDLEFNGGFAVYGYGSAERYIPFWTEEQECFYVYAGQNEGAYGITSNKNLKEEVAYVRYVRDV